MSRREPNFDIDLEIGKQAELWVKDLRKALVEQRVEVKAPKPFLREQSAYVEYSQLRRNGWELSGIATTTSPLYLFTFGDLPGGLVVETQWLKRAARRAYRNPKQRRECVRGSHPTKGVVISLADLWVTRERDP